MTTTSSHSETVERCGPHGWGRVDDYEVRVVEDRFELPATDQLAIDLLDFEQIVSIDINRIGKKLLEVGLQSGISYLNSQGPSAGRIAFRKTS